jgi:hypothetical protein
VMAVIDAAYQSARSQSQAVLLNAR